MAPNTEHSRTLLHPGFVGAGAALLIAAFITDLMYYRTALMQWANFSAWLIVFGLVLALIAAVLLVLDFVLGRAGRLNWFHFILVVAAALLSLLNMLVHSRDAWTSVVPQGIVFSAIVTVMLLIVGFGGWNLTTVRTIATGTRP